MEAKEMSAKKKRIIICVAVLVIVIAIGIISVTAYLLTRDKGGDSGTGGTGRLPEVVVEEYNASECVSVGKYKGREVSLLPDEDDIQIEVDSLIEEYTTYEQKKGIAQEGDMVYAEFEGYIGGERKDDTCGSDYIEIGSETWLPGFESAIIGMQCGQTKKFNIDVPKDTYGDDSIDGKTVEFKLTLKYICGESIIPDYDDEFVQSISKYETVKEYNAYLKKKLTKENEEDKLEIAWGELMYDCEVKKYPKTLLESARKEVLQGYYELADLYGISHDEVFQSFGCEDEQDFKETQLQELAEDTVKEILVAETIAEKENISYKAEDYDQILDDEYENNSDAYESREEYEKYNKNYLEHTALTVVVKDWIGENTTFITK